MKMQHYSEGDMVHQPRPKILAQRNSMHISSFARRFYAGFELGDPSRRKLLMRHSYKGSVVQEAPHAQTVHDLLVRVTSPTLHETGDDEMDHENQGRGGWVQSQDAFKLREGRTFDT